MVNVDHDCGVGGGRCPECTVTHHLHQALDVATQIAAEAHGRRVIRQREGKPPCVVACTPEEPCDWLGCPNASARDVKRLGLEELLRNGDGVPPTDEALPGVGDVRLVRAAESTSTTLREQVLEFHRVFDHPVRETPGPITDERVRFRARLIAEEFFEVLEACFTDEVVCDGSRGHNTNGTDPCPSCGNKYHVVGFDGLREHVLEAVAKAQVRIDLPELADGIADLMYVAEGTNLEFGIDSGPIAAEVHRANMTKRGGGKRADGKSLKPAGWRGPDIEGELKRQGWKP